MASVIRAVFGYCFLVFMVRVIGRRPGKQMTPFDHVLVFFMGGLALTPMVGNDRSIGNGITIVISIAMTHYLMTWLKHRSPRIGRIVDGTPLVLIDNGQWEPETLRRMSIHEMDVMAAARDKGLLRIEQIQYAVLERNGEISISQYAER